MDIAKAIQILKKPYPDYEELMASLTFIVHVLKTSDNFDWDDAWDASNLINESHQSAEGFLLNLVVQEKELNECNQYTKAWAAIAFKNLKHLSQEPLQILLRSEETSNPDLIIHIVQMHGAQDIDAATYALYRIIKNKKSHLSHAIKATYFLIKLIGIKKTLKWLKLDRYI